MSLPRNITELAEKNGALLDKLGFTPDRDDPYDLCNEGAYRKTNLFDAASISSMFSGGETQGTQSDKQTEIARKIGMILVRPDMVHITSEFERFISDRYSILDSQSVAINSDTYWKLYRHDFYRVETMHCRLTRAALYIGSQCRLILFQSASEQPDIATADYARGPLKGRQGVYEPNTLRGDIVYRQALELGLHRLDDPDIDECLKLAADPFAAYRKLSGDTEHVSQSLLFPLLFFTGVGVHVPDYSELGNDLAAFTDITKPPYSTSS